MVRKGKGENMEGGDREPKGLKWALNFT